jgi:predicted anti-sigma-YlaC factor YlaD
MADQTHTRCLKVLDLLPRFIENDFTEEEAEEIRKHLDSCLSCRAEYDSMLKLMDTLETLPVLSVPPSFKEAVMRQLPSAKKPEKP